MKKTKKPVQWFMPCTPGGTICNWLKAKTEEEAWNNLLKDAAHMPYEDKGGFIERGYTVVCFVMGEEE